MNIRTTAKSFHIANSGLFIACALLASTSLHAQRRQPHSSPPGPSTPETSLNLTGYHLTFDDEFNSFNTSVWATEFPWGARTQNIEQEYYGDPAFGAAMNPFFIQNGALVIQASKLPSSYSSQADGKSYVSGLITTFNSFKQTYGYFEIRAKMPVGVGFAPDFWMLPVTEAWPPEIDIVEIPGQTNNPTAIYTSAHYVDNTGADTAYTTGVATSDVSAAYHTYGVNWQPTTLTFYMDGAVVYTCPTPSDMQQPMYLLANVAVGGGDWYSAPNSTTPWPGKMEIDYVRAFSNNASVPGVSLQTISSPDGGGMNLYGATSGT